MRYASSALRKIDSKTDDNRHRDTVSWGYLWNTGQCREYVKESLSRLDRLAYLDECLDDLSEKANTMKDSMDGFLEAVDETADAADCLREDLGESIRWSLTSIVQERCIISLIKELQYTREYMHQRGVEPPAAGKYITLSDLQWTERHMEAADAIPEQSSFFCSEEKEWAEWYMELPPEERTLERLQDSIKELTTCLKEEALTEEELELLISAVAEGCNSGELRHILGEQRMYDELADQMRGMSPVQKRLFLQGYLPSDLEDVRGLDGIVKLFRFLIMDLDRLHAEAATSSENAEDLPFI